MVTTFNKRDLRSFFYYMTSDERRERYKNHPEMGDTNLEKRLSTVNGGDIDQWMQSELRKKKG